MVSDGSVWTWPVGKAAPSRAANIKLPSRLGRWGGAKHLIGSTASRPSETASSVSCQKYQRAHGQQRAKGGRSESCGGPDGPRNFLFSRSVEHLSTRGGARHSIKTAPKGLGASSRQLTAPDTAAAEHTDWVLASHLVEASTNMPRAPSFG